MNDFIEDLLVVDEEKLLDVEIVYKFKRNVGLILESLEKYLKLNHKQIKWKQTSM